MASSVFLNLTDTGSLAISQTPTTANALDLGSEALPWRSAYLGTSLALADAATLGWSDVSLSRGAANRVDLATGDSLFLVSGGLGVGTANTTAGSIVASGPVKSLGGITAAGATGVPVVVAVGRVTAQSDANASISTFTVGAADASFEVSGNMNVTASTVLTTTLTVTYTDESNTARSMILPVASLAGSFIAAGAITGAGATVWETPVMHIRCKAATVITILTSAGTFTGVTYTAEGVIKQTK